MQNINKNLFILFLALIISISFLIIYSSANLSTMGRIDSCVFFTVGFSWTENILPYRDLFDHKGPVLYILNALGFLLYNEFYGVLFIEIIFLTITTIIFFLLCGKNKYSFIATYIFILFYFKIVFEYGNLTEEYAITFNMIAIYVFTQKYAKRFYSYGVLGGLLFLLRPNLAAPTLLIFIIDLIRCRQEDNPVHLTIKCASGFAIPLLPILFYFYVNNGLYDFIKSYLFFNFKYTNIVKQNFLYVEFVHVVKNFYFYIHLLFIFFLIARKNLQAFCITFSTFLFSLLMTAISSRDYNHYFMLTIPSILFAFSTAIRLYESDRILLAIFYKYQENITLLKKKLQSPKIFVPVTILCLLPIIHYIGIIIYCLNTDHLTRIRNFFSQSGITNQSSILNLADHHATQIFYLLKITPKEKDFFPESASITNKYSEVLSKHFIPCPNENYDLVIVPQSKELSCPQYTLFKTPLEELRIYKQNAQ